MKLLILQEKLKEGFNIIERILGGSLFNLPILNNTLITAQKNLINLSATNLEIGINWWSLSKIEKEGEIIIPIHLLYNFLNLLPNKIIILEKKDNNLNIECENYKTQIKGLLNEDFPIIPQFLKEDYIELENNFFCQALKQVVDITFPSQSRPEISGILFSFQNNTLKLVATDSFRLGEKTISLKENQNFIKNFEKNISFILPQKTIKEVINIFDKKEGKLKIYFAPNQILFENQMSEIDHPCIQLTSRLIEGEYPFYQEIIPKKYDTKVILDKNAFLNQIKIASLFGGKTNEIKLKINPKKSEIEIFSQCPELGEHHSVLGVKTEGHLIEVLFNYKFLIDGLLNIKGSEIIFELNKNETPVMLKSEEDLNYFYIIMPIKTE